MFQSNIKGFSLPQVLISLSLLMLSALPAVNMILHSSVLTSKVHQSFKHIQHHMNQYEIE